MAQRVDINYIQYYTQGSAAKKVAPAISVHTGALPQIKKRAVQKIYVDPVACLGAVIAVCMLVTMLVGWSDLRAEQAKTAQMVEQVEMLQQQNEALHAQYTEACNLEEIEEAALALGMIPRQEASHTAIQIELPPVQEKPVNMWQKIGTFLTGLFA